MGASLSCCDPSSSRRPAAENEGEEETLTGGAGEMNREGPSGKYLQQTSSQNTDGDDSPETKRSRPDEEDDEEAEAEPPTKVAAADEDEEETAEAETFVIVEPPEEQSDAPEPPAPTVPMHIGLLRHSARIDGLELPALADLGSDPRYAWEDRLARPYDTPISDFELPHTAATQLSEYGFTKIVSSPFRRCLQTAAVAARALGVPTVDVHKGVGEGMAQVKRNGWTDGPDHQLIYLSDEEMWVALVGSAASLDTASQVWR